MSITNDIIGDDPSVVRSVQEIMAQGHEERESQEACELGPVPECCCGTRGCHGIYEPKTAILGRAAQ